MPKWITVEYVDTSAEYGFFGKVVAKSDIRGMTDAEIVAEVEHMLQILGNDIGNHISARYVEEIGPVALHDGDGPWNNWARIDPDGKPY